MEEGRNGNVKKIITLLLAAFLITAIIADVRRSQRNPHNRRSQRNQLLLRNSPGPVDVNPQSYSFGQQNTSVGIDGQSITFFTDQ
jgi:hypothetical protein